MTKQYTIKITFYLYWVWCSEQYWENISSEEDEEISSPDSSEYFTQTLSQAENQKINELEADYEKLLQKKIQLEKDKKFFSYENYDHIHLQNKLGKIVIPLFEHKYSRILYKLNKLKKRKIKEVNDFIHEKLKNSVNLVIFQMPKNDMEILYHQFFDLLFEKFANQFTIWTNKNFKIVYIFENDTIISNVYNTFNIFMFENFYCVYEKYCYFDKNFDHFFISIYNKISKKYKCVDKNKDLNQYKSEFISFFKKDFVDSREEFIAQIFQLPSVGTPSKYSEICRDFVTLITANLEINKNTYGKLETEFLIYIRNSYYTLSKKYEFRHVMVTNPI